MHALALVDEPILDASSAVPKGPRTAGRRDLCLWIAHRGSRSIERVTTNRDVALGPEDCRKLLVSASLGRIALSIGALPSIHAVQYGIYGDDIVFPTPPEHHLARALDGAVVAFEAGSHADGRAAGWSVVVIGEAQIVDDDDYCVAAGDSAPPGGGSGHDQLVRIPMTVVSGRMLSRTETESNLR